MALGQSLTIHELLLGVQSNIKHMVIDRYNNRHQQDHIISHLFEELRDKDSKQSDNTSRYNLFRLINRHRSKIYTTGHH